MSDIRTLEPKPIWNHFADLNSVPRPSKKEERVIDFMRNFGNSLNLPTTVDKVGNVIIKKPATKGQEHLKTIVLQGHIDMVHQKNTDTNFDFDKEGINMFVDGDWVKAKGTTLGADNGIGVAAIMALLSSDSIPHPALEALFTIDEETGMTGANELEGGLLDGAIMLNLDTEDDRELTIGCAGGVDVTAEGNYVLIDTPASNKTFKISLRGLSGGHSGMDIHLGRGNANKLMNRLLKTLITKFDTLVVSIDGGGLRNAIPRESFSKVSIPEVKIASVKEFILEFEGILQSEFKTTDPNVAIQFEETEDATKVVDGMFANKLVNALYACHFGIYRMSPDLEDLVQTSNNLARVLVKDGKYTIQCLTRSAVDSEKMDLAESLKSCFQLIGANVKFEGSYPGWTPRPEASIVKIMTNLYRDKYKSEPLVSACHAGLECGILGRNYPDMEMISFGPNIRGAHSPDEKVQISSVQKFWDLLLETLNKIPIKN